MLCYFQVIISPFSAKHGVIASAFSQKVQSSVHVGVGDSVQHDSTCAGESALFCYSQQRRGVLHVALIFLLLQKLAIVALPCMVACRQTQTNKAMHMWLILHWCLSTGRIELYM